MIILKFLEKNKIVKDYIINDFKSFSNGFYFNIKVILIDNSELYIKEYSDKNERNYSYHWQNKDGKIIVRRDNSPYHKEIKTYPHHKHIKDQILDNYNI